MLGLGDLPRLTWLCAGYAVHFAAPPQAGAAQKKFPALRKNTCAPGTKIICSSEQIVDIVSTTPASQWG